MALVLADRVQDTTTSTGTGAIALDNAPPTGFQSFAVVGNGNTTYYTIVGGSEWEVGIGTYNSTGPSLVRDTVLSSSNSNSLVNFSAGTKTVFVTYPAEKSVNEDASGNVNISITGNAATATQADNLSAGTAGAIPYQTAANTTSFVTSAAGVLVGGTTPAFSTTPTLTGTNFTGIPNAALTNSSVTLGTTSVALGATSLTIAGLTSVTLTQDPTTALQAATKQYVDTLAAEGVSYHAPVKYEAPNPLTATYNNGTAGVGATLTNAGTQTAFTPDGVVAQVGDRILIYQQASAVQNGIYTVTTLGSGSTNWVLTRATDANSYGVKDPNKLGAGDAFFVTSGDTGAGETYVMNTTGTITFGTTAINFVQVSAAQIYSAGTGLTLTGTQFSLTSPVATNLGGTGLTGFTAANRAIYSTSSSALTAGTLPVAAGGTGSDASYTDGQLLIGRSSDGSLVKATLTASTGISVSNGAGSISITNTAPDQTVTLTGGGTTTISGSYPNFNITSNDQYVGTVTSVSGTGTVNGLTLTGTVTSSGSLTLGGTLSVNLASSDVTGTLPVANGGTGATSLTSGYLVKGNGTSAVTASVVYDDGTNVGIGTSSPSDKLSVAGGRITLDQDFQIVWQNAGTNRGRILADSSSSVIIENGASNTERMRIDSSGNVGIGTSSPGYRLDVASGETVSGYAARLRSNATATAAILQFTNSSVTQQNGLLAVNDTGVLTLQADGAASAISFRTNGAEQARITSAGYLEATYSDKVVALGNTGTAKTIDLTLGNVFTATLTGNCTFTLSSANANSNRGSSFTLILTNDGTAGRTVAWSGGSFRFPGGASAISRTTTASATDIWVFFTPDNGTTWYGNISMKDMKA